MVLRSLKSLLFISSLVVTASILQACSKPSQNTTADVTGGKIQGTDSGKVISFKGIPFAAAPVADNRWRAPQPVVDWEGVKNTTEFAPDCMQKPFAGDAAPLTTLPTEDCLYLNVFKPTKQGQQPYPVVVWIHGGGFVNGGSSPDVYSGESFAKQDVVFVSFNYRLGRFGFFAHPALSKFADDALGNYAFMDQIAALDWVKDNISQFGGDPQQVTLMGESAGGESVHAMMQTPAAQGLFNKAIIMSGGGRKLFNQLPLKSDDKNTLSAEQVGLNFAAQYDIKGDDKPALKALRMLSADKLVDGLNLASMTPNRKAPTYVGGPILDGTLVSSSIENALNEGNFSHVPVMVGTTNHDISFANYSTKEALFNSFGTHAAQAKQAYDSNDKKDLDVLNYETGQDSLMQEPARFVAQQVSKFSQPAFLYRFGYVAQTVDAQGAAHASEIPYFFNTATTKYGHITTDQDKQMAKIMHRYVTNFIKHGSPNGPGLPSWRAFKGDESYILQLNKEGTATFTPDPREARLNVTKLKTSIK
ncbi:MAG: carboxylesterase/lipase family protein [Pseudoalteromonas sp.]|uniref:carboxylesterase/lipase family protein n=1 Tax=unclassified Pseudoalteromonas TaxID=194690 RepID=UPI003F9D1FA7